MPGRGYWVKADGDGVLSETVQTPKQFLAMLGDPDLKIDFNASTDQGETQIVSIGIDSSATEGIDTHLGEQEMPPPPPSEIFFIRFTLPNSFISSYSDIRFGKPDENYIYEHELKFQLGEDGVELKLRWDQPQGVSINIQDMFGGVIVNEDFTPGTNEFTLTNTNITSLKLTAEYAGVTSVDYENKPIEYVLYQNYPNPFNPTTTIKFSIGTSPSVPLLSKERDARVRLDVYNALGQKVRTLIDKEMKPGYHEVEFNADDLSSGIFFYRIITGEFTAVKKMILIK